VSPGSHFRHTCGPFVVLLHHDDDATEEVQIEDHNDGTGS